MSDAKQELLDATAYLWAAGRRVDALCAVYLLDCLP